MRAADATGASGVAGAAGAAGGEAASGLSGAAGAGLAAVVALYLAVVLFAPLVALVGRAAGTGLPAVLASLSTPEARSALTMTLALVAVALGVNGVAGPLGAVVLVRHRFPGRRLVSALCDLPLAVSPVMVGLAFLLLFGRGGWAEPLLTALDLKVVFAFPGLVVATLFVTLPYTVREVAYVLEELGTGDEEAAVSLGASAWQAFVRVTLPNIRSALGYGLLMTASRTLGEFGAILVLGGSISGHTQTATTFIHDAVEERAEAGAYGMALVLAASSLALLLGLELLRRRRAAEEEGR